MQTCFVRLAPAAQVKSTSHRKKNVGQNLCHGRFTRMPNVACIVTQLGIFYGSIKLEQY
jgi:hypothetical protein